MREPVSLEIPGTFGLGCNYWASHAGTAMWSDWRPEIVASDFQKLAQNGVELVRVFPLWPDFQPITQLRGSGGHFVEIRMGEAPLPFDCVGQAGVSREMLDRFSMLCELAEKNGLKLIVALVTGWMSGRLFVPPALEGLDPITHPTSIAWQIKMVRTLVSQNRDQTAILAWDLGNECNCMGKAANRDAAYIWTASIANAIRAADASRPVVSGMHSLATPIGAGNAQKEWTIDDQAELTDILTTHPYPYWTRHTRSDAVNTLRTTLHATAESRFYGDIGGKPCFAEEIGTMGPLVASDQVSADFARANLFSLWANDCRAFMWWCAHDQTELETAPYDWIGVETELGLLRNDGTPKPVLLEMGRFRQFLSGLPFETLPPRKVDGVCLLTHNQDDWAAAYSAFVLAKQAGFDLEFRHIGQEIPESDLYLLPSITGLNCIPRRQWLELIQRVKTGATLYISLGDGIVSRFGEIAGVELQTRSTAKQPMEVVLEEGTRLPLWGADDLRFEARGAQILGTRADTGTPIFWKNALGEGQIVIYAAPLETSLSTHPGAFDDDAPAFYRVYDELAKTTRAARWVAFDSSSIAITQHLISDNRALIVAINHTREGQTLEPALSPRIELAQVLRGEVKCSCPHGISVAIPAFDAVVFVLERI